ASIGLAKTCQHRFHVVIVRIESKQTLRLHFAALLGNDCEQFFLALEVNVEGALRDSRLAGNLTHARRVDALRQKDGSRAIDNLASLGSLLRWVRGLCCVFDQVWVHGVSCSQPGDRTVRSSLTYAFPSLIQGGR